jgi:hypothetical protein
LTTSITIVCCPSFRNQRRQKQKPLHLKNWEIKRRQWAQRGERGKQSNESHHQRSSQSFAIVSIASNRAGTRLLPLAFVLVNWH